MSKFKLSGVEPPRTEDSTRSLVAGVVDDVQALFRKELMLAREETRREVQALGVASLQFATGAAAVGAAGLLLACALALGVAAAFGWPAWAGFALMGVLLGIPGLLIARSGHGRMRKVPTRLSAVVGERKEEYGRWLNEVTQ